MNHEIQSLLDQRVIEKYTSLNDSDFTSYNINDEVIGTAGSAHNSGNGSFGFSQIQAQLFPMSSSNSPGSSLHIPIDPNQISTFNTPTFASNQYQQPISPPQSLPQYQIQNNQQYDNSFNVPSPSQDSYQQQQQQHHHHHHQQQQQQQHQLSNHQQNHFQNISVPSNAILTIHSNSFQQQIQHQPLSPQQQIPINTNHFIDNNINNYNIVPIHSNNNTINHNNNPNNGSLGSIMDIPSSPLSQNGSSTPTSPYTMNIEDQQLIARMNRSNAQFNQMYTKIEPNYAEDDLKSNKKKQQTKKGFSKKEPYTTSSSAKANSKSKDKTQKEKSFEKCREAIELHKKIPQPFCSEPKIEFLPRQLIPEPHSVTNNHIITPPTVIKLNLPAGNDHYSNYWVTARLTEKDKFKIDYTKEHFDWDGYCTFNIKIEKPKGNEKTDKFNIRYDLFTEDEEGNPKYLGNIVSNDIRYCYHTSSLPNPKIEFCSPSFINSLAREPKLELNSSFFKHGDAHPLVILFLDQNSICVHEDRPNKSCWTSEWSIIIQTPILAPGVYRIHAVYLKKNEEVNPSFIKNLDASDSCEITYSDNTIIDASLINNYNGGNSNGSGNGPNGNNNNNNSNNGRGNGGPNSNNGNNNNGYYGNGNSGSGNGGSGGNFYYQYSVNIADTTNNQFYKIYKEISNCSSSELSKYETYRNIINETTGDSLLMYSILLNDKPTFNKLLLLNTKLSIINNAHYNALHYAAYASPKDNNEFFSRLVSHFEQKDQEELRKAVFSSNHYGKYLVHMLAEIKSNSNLLMILNKYPQVFGAQDARGYIPLHYMIIHADESGVSSLVDLWEKHSKSASLDQEEREELIESITLQSYNYETNALHLACSIGSVKMVNRLLNIRQFDLYEQDSNEEYCIHKAIGSRKYDVIRLLKFIGFDISLVMDEMKQIEVDLEITEDENSFIDRCQLGSIPKSYSVVDIQVDNTVDAANSDEQIDNVENDVNTNELINKLLTLSHSDSNSSSSSFTPSSSSSSSSSSRSIPPVSSSSSSSSSHLPKLISEVETSGNTTTYTFGSSNKKLDQIIEQLAQKIRNLETTNKTLEKKINDQDRLRDPSDPTEETYLDAINRFVKNSGGVYQRIDRKTGKMVELSSDTLNAFKENCKSLPSSVIGKIISQTEKDGKLIVDVDFYFEQNA